MGEKKAKRSGADSHDSGHHRQDACATRNTRFKPGNATRFQPGESGNPGGRPKLLGEAYRHWLARRCTDAKKLAFYAAQAGERVDRADPPTNAEVIAARGIHSAIAGKDAVRYARELREATEGAALAPGGAVLLAFAGMPGTDAVKKMPAPQGGTDATVGGGATSRSPLQAVERVRRPGDPPAAVGAPAGATDGR